MGSRSLGVEGFIGREMEGWKGEMWKMNTITGSGKPAGRKNIAMGSERSEDPRKNVPIMPISPIGRQDMSVQLNSVAQRGCLKVTVQTRGSASLHRHRYVLSPCGLYLRLLITCLEDERSRGGQGFED